MAAPLPLDANRLPADGGFVASLHPDDLVYFATNVGDGDAQLLLLPQDPDAKARRAIVVDAARRDKVPPLIDLLIAEGLLPSQADGRPAPDTIALVVATHPHLDHVGGIPQLLTKFAEKDPEKRGSITEFWDPGYFHTLAEYHDMMAAIEAQPRLTYSQPTSGYRRWISNVEVTVLAPAIHLRNRYDSYGVQINDSSISLRVEFPASRVLQLDKDRNYIGSRNTQALVLGADAQTLSWSYVLTDFPELVESKSAVAKALKAATGSDPLRADVLKISHHASKHGVNLELVERIHPRVTVISSVGQGGTHGFPHTVAQELIREALQPIAGSRTVPPPQRESDADLKVFYTGDLDTAGVRLGSIAIVLGRGRSTIWRFGDDTGQAISFQSGRRWT